MAETCAPAAHPRHPIRNNERWYPDAQTFDAAINGVEVLLADTKDRVGKMEAFKQGGREAVAAIYALAGFIAILLAIGGTLAATGRIGA